MKLPEVSRRSFLKWSAVVGAGAAIGGASMAKGGLKVLEGTAEAAGTPVPDKVVWQQCTVNCGGYSCALKLHVKDDVIIRVDTDQEDRPGFPAMRACQRGRATRQFVYSPDRLKQPMKRVGKRGEGKFEPITWDEAYTLIAENLDRIIKTYGNHAVYNHYASGTDGTTRTSIPRLLNMLGGYLNYYGTYSSACYSWAAPYTYGGTPYNSSDDLVNSRLIVLFANNAGETQPGGGNEFYWQMQAKKAGAKIIVVDPRLSDTAKAIADEWIPIRPTTDNALMDALAYVMITENLHDQAFLDKYCIGFDDEHLPPSAPPKSSYKSYVLGEADGVPKTPEWAEAITGVPRETIVRLAREIALTKPCALIQNLGWQRHAYGEQPVRGLPVLAAMTGNIGVKGGGTGLRDGRKNAPSPSIPAGTNPVKASIPVFMWTEAIVRGTELTAKDGLRGVDRLESNIKFIWNYGGNTLINQHSDTRDTHRILQDESLCEFIVVHDVMMTPSARYADVLLPDATSYERLHLGRGSTNVMGDRYYLGVPAITPLFDVKTNYEVCAGVAEKLGIGDKFTEGKTWEDWCREAIAAVVAKNPGFPTWEQLLKDPIVRGTEVEPIIGLASFVADPEKNPLSTPSGKIEIYSEQLAELAAQRGNADELPPIPKYIPSWEGPQDPLREKYPIQLVGHHVKRRVHSTHDNNPWLEEVEPQMITLNELDAAERGIKDGDMVRVWNDRGEIHVRCRVSKAIMPGVADLPQGAWYTPNGSGVDVRGCINTVTKYHPTPGAKGNPQHTNLVQVAKL
ncbi:anaerobic dimethyl sulfoxide reductase subunit A [Symbiobacterium terraclitae]|uniref:Anaerobic dimethyl sulfoxide reductase subunit A n=1 Tax=Symbiobacterium terraclitae TaxID=557451 RepID=A0ABS4JT87_9FIRM|nr:anaerobic dimethyl sulfoxide reductase subunit A [Symbiobacterium terraclitae]